MLSTGGEKSLFKIAGQVRKAFRVDQATKNRDKLMFAKVLVEVNLGQVYPKIIQFVNEKGTIVDQPVEYYWLTTICSYCKGLAMRAGSFQRPINHHIGECGFLNLDNMQELQLSHLRTLGLHRLQTEKWVY